MSHTFQWPAWLEHLEPEHFIIGFSSETGSGQTVDTKGDTGADEQTVRDCLQLREPDPN